ncbi:MAG: hypothetical protein ACP5ME_14960 [Anaerolineae bacterium]
MSEPSNSPSSICLKASQPQPTTFFNSFSLPPPENISLYGFL